MKRCAIYTRVSTTMQAEVEYNSCEAQRDRILSYIKSQENLKVYREYSDPGFSAATLERPALKELLRDVAGRKIDAILTYKIDRLTRSSKDFYNLIEHLEKYDVAFVSVSEHFDTSSASGRLLRNIMLTFAQFEREMTSERIRDKFEQRAKKGLWNGAALPLGYKGVDKKLLVDSKWSKVIRAIFEDYVSHGSIKQTMRYVRSENILHPRNKGPLSLNAVFHILRNPVYIGKIRWHDKVFPGIHEPIVSEELFERVQSLTGEKVKKRRLFKEFLLSGLVKCSECGSTMTNSFVNKKNGRYYYYRCTKISKEGYHTCSIKEVNSEKLEAFLIENISRIAQDRQYIEGLAFKNAFQMPRHTGIELTQELIQKQADTVQEALLGFKCGVEKATQIEKCLIFERTIEGVTFSKQTLEVVVSLSDGRAGVAGKADLRRAQLPAARIRVGEHESQDLPRAGSPGFSVVETGLLAQTPLTTSIFG